MRIENLISKAIKMGLVTLVDFDGTSEPFYATTRSDLCFAFYGNYGKTIDGDLAAWSGTPMTIWDMSTDTVVLG